MNIAKNRSDDDIVPDLEVLRTDIVALKRDVGDALRQLKANAISGVRTTAEEVTDQFAEISKDLTKSGKRALKSVNGQIAEQPLTSVLIAFATGFIASRLLLR